MFKLQQLIRNNIKKLAPYTSARSEYKGDARIFIDANENPFNTNVNRYPDPLQIDLKKEIAKIKSISPENMFLGNGSDEAIDLLIRVFCEPQQDNIIILPPTYGMYKVLAETHNIQTQEVLLTPNFQISPIEILKKVNKNTKLLFICSPNNPTANLIEKELIIEILQEFNGIVIVDEAYIDFSPHGTMLPLIQQYPNLVILQTFSKAWGMAAIRLGMAFASTEIINLVNKIKMPYNVSILTQQYTVKYLKSNEKREIKDKNLQSILRQKNILQQQLKKITLVKKIYPSDANFMLIEVEDATKVYNLLKSRGIIVRNRTNEPHCKNCLRITVGTPQENKQLIEILQVL